jgi:hypothetical protein
MAVTLDAKVMRTADGLDHVNRLCVSRFAIAEFRLETSDGKLKSKTHFPEGCKAPDGGSDDFHFVPEREKLVIRYKLEDPFRLVTKAAIELYVRFNEKPLWKRDLKPAEYLDGEHKIEWDGKLEKARPEDFPDEYVTLEHSPYKLRLSIGSDHLKGDPGDAWTYFHILVHSLELELGPVEAIPAATIDDDRHKQDKALFKVVKDAGGLPAKGKTRKIFLPSNIFKTALAQMETNKLCADYAALWGDGPRVPIVAKIRLRDSGDKEVKLESEKGAVALGRAKFLWDWVNPEEQVDARQADARPKKFIKDAINYYRNGTDATRPAKDHTYQVGDNCHVDRGGKRGPDAKHVFPSEPGYSPKETLETGKFPFHVITGSEATGPTHRKWSSFSEPWSKGVLKGRTGVLFEPSHMAGDRYEISVYLSGEKSKKGEHWFDEWAEKLNAPPAVVASMGVHEIWREVHASRYVRKKSSMTSFFPASLGGTQKHFRMAYVELVDKMGADNNYSLSQHRFSDGSVPDYNTLLRTRLAASGQAIFTFDLATDPADDHSAVDSMVKVRSYADFVKKAHLALNAGVPGAVSDLSNLAAANATTIDNVATQFGAWNTAGWAANAANLRLQATQTWLQGWSAETAAKYAAMLDNVFFSFGEPFAGDLKLVTGSKVGVGKEAVPGVITMEFNFTNTCLRDLNAGGAGLGYWYGAAVDPGDADEHRCVIMFWKSGVDFFSHEFGHHMFLPHAKYPTASPPDGAKENRHDDVDDGCLMSYSNNRPSFCGFCQLRMRGWNANKLNKLTAKNTKP